MCYCYMVYWVYIDIYLPAYLAAYIAYWFVITLYREFINDKFYVYLPVLVVVIFEPPFYVPSSGI